jgi:DNA-binding transcriptional ArsR family regulator
MARRCAREDGASCWKDWRRSWRVHERALGDPTRRAIVETLSERPQSVSRLAAPLAITLAAVVQHLQILEASGLVRTEKAGRVRTCQIEPAGLSVAETWISERRAIWERRFDRLGDLLAEPDEE